MVTPTNRLTRVPNKPKTPVRNFRIEDELWAAVQAEAERRGETVSDFVRRAMKRYVRGK